MNLQFLGKKNEEFMKLKVMDLKSMHLIKTNLIALRKDDAAESRVPCDFH